MKPSHTEFITVRGFQYHIRHWGNDDAPKLYMLHGWMDVSASFQFVADCLQGEWHVIAPDWRGFGLTRLPFADGYWYPDYLGDLDAVLCHYSAHEPVNLLGHSMGGNIACVYAGVRPERIKTLINLEGFGLPATRPEQAPARYAKWLDELIQPPVLRTYATLADVAVRLQKNNPRLDDEKAAFLAQHWATKNTQEEWQLLADPLHKRINPSLYQIEEVLACWRAITAPTLWVEATESRVWRYGTGTEEEARQEIQRRIQHIKDVRIAKVHGAGHMLHHDQPQAVAHLVEQFLMRKT
jgi:pimeloyl-ACP methyl ester carboxylesterase